LLRMFAESDEKGKGPPSGGRQKSMPASAAEGQLKKEKVLRKAKRGDRECQRSLSPCGGGGSTAKGSRMTVRK